MMKIMVLALLFGLRGVVTAGAGEGVLPEPPTPELCPNGDFEEGTQGWRFVYGGYGAPREGWQRAGQRAQIIRAGAYHGEAALLLDATGLEHELDVYSEVVEVRPDTPYKLSSYVRQLAGEGAYKVVIDWKDAEGQHIRYDNDWKGHDRPPTYTFHGGIFVSPSNAARANLILGVAAGVKCLFDGVSLRELPEEPLSARPRRDGDGKVTIEPAGPVVANSFVTWKFTYTAGPSGLPVGGAIRLERSNVNNRWSPFQTRDPQAAGYVTAKASSGSRLRLSVSPPTRVPQSLTVQVEWPPLKEGDTVEVLYGDRTGGGPGVQVQPEVEAGLRWLVASDANRDGEFGDLPPTPPFNVVPGPARRLFLRPPLVAEAGRPCRVEVTVQDESGNPVPDFAGKLTFASSDPQAVLPPPVSLQPPQGGRATVEVTFHTPGRQTLAVQGGEGLAGAEVSLLVSVLRPPLPEEPSPAARARRVGEHVVLENEHLRLVFVRNPWGYGYAPLFAWDGKKWVQAGALISLGAIYCHTPTAAEEGESVLPVYASAVELGEGALTFHGDLWGPEGSRWQAEAQFRLTSGARHVTTRFTLRSTRPQTLRAFYGPMLYAGEGSFGPHKSTALFPAVEYLAAAERSSDTKGVAWGFHQRFVPHPYKITLPLMAVASPLAPGSSPLVVALLWDPLQKWDGKNVCPAAKFASPNWLENRANHLLALFVPAVPQWVPENGEAAGTPYQVLPERPLRIKADLAVLCPAEEATAAVRYWFAQHGPPELPPLPRPLEEELNLCARGYLETAWTERDRGWIPAVGRPPGFNETIARHLWEMAHLTSDAPLRERIEQQLTAALEERGRGGYGFDLALRWGRVEDALAGLKRAAYRAMHTQRPDGSWTFAQVYSQAGRRRTLAAAEDVELGTCVIKLEPILRYACVTGDPAVLPALRKGLAYLERFRRPAGAESWEVPLVCPNLRAAALAVRCYLDAYRLTGEAHYLEKAKYWATTGLPFIYHWSAPDRPIMKGASISVMGTTFYTHPWFGRAVQWVGLVYAEALRQLAPYEPDFPWRAVADLITIAALQQQKTEEAPCGHVGFYPDSYSLLKGADSYEWCLSPVGIVQNLLPMMGREPGVATTILGPAEPKVHVSTAAVIRKARFDPAEQTLRLRLAYYPHEPCYLLVTHLSRPKAVLCAGQEVPEVEELDAAPQGWYLSPFTKHLLVKVAAAAAEFTLSFTGVRAVPHAPEELPSRLRNGGFEAGFAGWHSGDPPTRVRIVTDEVHGGQQALLLDAVGRDREVQANSYPLRVKGGRKYRLTSYVKQLVGEGIYKVTIDWLGEGEVHLSYENDWQGHNRPAEYTLHGGIFRAPPEARAARLILGVQPGVKCLFDDLSLEPVEPE